MVSSESIFNVGRPSGLSQDANQERKYLSEIPHPNNIFAGDQRTRRISMTSSPSCDGSYLSTPGRHVRLPPSPCCPDEDTFWNSHVDDWNEHHSPRRITLRRIATEGSSNSYHTSPNKQDEKKRRNRKAKMAFQKAKKEMAMEFLQELDSKLTQGRVSELSAATGGVKIVWTRALRSTAGKARVLPLPSKLTPEFYEAKIELSERIVTNKGSGL